MTACGTSLFAAFLPLSFAFAFVSLALALVSLGTITFGARKGVLSRVAQSMFLGCTIRYLPLKLQLAQDSVLEKIICPLGRGQPVICIDVRFDLSGLAELCEVNDFDVDLARGIGTSRQNCIKI